METTELSGSSLKEKWESFRSENPKVRIRDAAKQLNSSEAELLATGLGESVVRLEGDFEQILKEIEPLGKVMALTRNDYVVHERKGVYVKVSFNNHVGLALGDDIDLRLFMGRWHFAFAVSENDRYSLQFFDKGGEAVHKIYLTDNSDKAEYDKLVAKYTSSDQGQIAAEAITKPEEVQAELSEEELASFKQEWLDLKDTHEFFGLIRKYKLPRTQSLRLAPEGFAYQVSPSSVPKLFENVAAQELPIMVFVGNAGCIQIHTGPVKKLFVMGPWFNVMDPDFNLHLREDAISEAWVVIKPTTDGIVTGVELYAADGSQIAQIFGKRKPGIPELGEWQASVRDSLVKL